MVRSTKKRESAMELKKAYKIMKELEQSAEKMSEFATPDKYNIKLGKYLRDMGNGCRKMKNNLSENTCKLYENTFDGLISISNACRSDEFVKSNWKNMCDTSLLFRKCVQDILKLFHLKKCTVCQKEVVYTRISSYYEKMHQKYGHVKKIAETGNTQEYMCTSCEASDRDRMIVGFLKKLNLQYAKKEKQILQFAPAKAVDTWIRGECCEVTYHTTDLYRKEVSFKADITNMPEVLDASYDYWICSHVLEHVREDGPALRELMRILKPEGLGIFLVPVALDMEETEEEWGLSPQENWRRFGQDDHCRQYGKKDLLKRLHKEGIRVHEIGKDYFGQEFFEDAALLDTSTLYILTKSDKSLEELMRENKPERKKEENPLVSVIMSSYNHEEFVKDAIESVLNQTYRNIEFLVADDGSQDQTAEVMRRYSRHFAYEEYFAKNAGERISALVPKAKGKYIAHIHSDDTWEPDKIQKQITYLEEHVECDACTAWTDYRDRENHLLEEGEGFHVYNRAPEQWIHDFLFQYHGNCLCFPSSVWKKDIYQELISTSGNMAYKQLGDFQLWLILLQRGRIYVIPEILVHMKRHGTNVSVQNEENLIRHLSSYAHIVYRLIADMSSDLFVRVFQKEMIRPRASSPEEIACEKFFVLKNTGGGYICI